MKIFKIILLFFTITFCSYTVHKYYLSLTQITFKPKTKTVQVIINVFIDDIETALNKDYNIDLQLTTLKELKNNDIYFKKYLQDKLSFKINNINTTFNYLGKEYEGNLVYFYLEMTDVQNIKNIEITNKILINHFSKQQNLVKCNINKEHKSVLLSKNKIQSILEY